MLTKNQRTHAIVFKDWNKISITQSQYELYREEIKIKKHNDFITIHDIDTDEITYEWRCNEIKAFQAIKRDPTLWDKVTICSFWTRHELSLTWDCECSKKFWTLWILFKDELQKLWYKVFYDSDITKEMQEAYLNNK
jgi:hypothetical protein